MTTYVHTSSYISVYMGVVPCFKLRRWLVSDEEICFDYKERAGERETHTPVTIFRA